MKTIVATEHANNMDELLRGVDQAFRQVHARKGPAYMAEILLVDPVTITLEQETLSDNSHVYNLQVKPISLEQAPFPTVVNEAAPEPAPTKGIPAMLPTLTLDELSLLHRVAREKSREIAASVVHPYVENLLTPICVKLQAELLARGEWEEE